ncbi:MAG TPA: ankyrin repeat domain-containing protein [Acidobacteriota bacterium]|nr:ankyrin repeat domain-containing protein [Acidobacteriota bacterium]
MDRIAELRSAIDAGNSEYVISLVEQDSSLLGVRFPGNFTPLLEAASLGNRLLAQRLIQKGARIDIIAAVFLGRTDDVRTFLNQKPSLIYKRSPWGGISLLHLAATYADLDMVRLLLSHGLDPNESRNNARVTPLFFAYRPPYEKAELLLAHGADIRARAKHGFTVLHVAVTRGDEGWVEFLLSHGAETEVQTEDRQTPWALAVEGNQHRIAGILARTGRTRSKS